MTDLHARLAALPPAKRALLEERLRAQGVSLDAVERKTFPLSVMQQGIWFFEQLRPNNPAYVVSNAVRVRGPLDPGVLAEAVNEIVRRHEALRTTFRVRDGRPEQVVHPGMPIPLPVTDLRGAGAEALDRVIEQTLAEPFDLAAGPLLRLRLVRTGERETVLVVAMHHLVSDGWSMGVLLGELSALYAAFATGRPSPLPPLDVQYGDFAGWQQRQAAEDPMAEELAYWREHLAGAPDVLALPADRPRPAVQGFAGGSVPFDLPAEVMRELTALGRRHGATTFMVLLAGFQVLLHRYSGQDDIVVGMPTAGRGRAEIEPLIGFFVNTLPVRTGFGADPSFTQVLERVRDACLGAYAHQRVPFERIVTELAPARDLSRPPVFQTCLSYQADPLPSLDIAGIELQRLPLRAAGARFDLELQLFADGDRLTGWFEYDSALFNESTMSRLARHYRRILELICAAPESRVESLPLLSGEELETILEWGSGEVCEWPGTGWAHDCVAERARRFPDDVAVRSEGTGVTYGQLWSRVERLACGLRRRGTGRGALVGVCLERSVDLVAAVLAVLRAGGAFVPLDPDHPRERTRFMTADSGAGLVVASHATAGALQSADVPVVLVEDLLDEPAQNAAEVFGDDAEPVSADAAYVIYTSGSTGVPKGVVNDHGALRNRIAWMQQEYGLGRGERVLQKTPVSFDVSVWELLWPLMVGGTLVMARPGGHRDSGYLVDIVRAEQISTMHFVPSMLRLFLREERVSECDSLRRVLASGEALPQDLAARFHELCDAELHNLYGPTEAAIDVSSWRCDAEGHEDTGTGSVPIGRPIANARLYVLDRFLRPAPVGVAGELFIGGPVLARGYAGRPALTAERFTADPFTPGARMYRTGDVARFTADGVLEFLGRVDFQVKVRGFRIELGEIETVLAEHEHVSQAVVVAQDRGGGDARLAAYVTGPEPTGAGELIAHVRRRLPDYMVPSSFTFLPQIPLSSNGKVDRAALPAPGSARPELQSPFAAPRSALERRIAGIWSELLGVDAVGLHDNFFELGGHSLLLAEVRERLAESAGRDIPIVELFQHPTVAALAGHLTRPEGPAEALGGADRARRRLSSREHGRRTAARRGGVRKGD